MRVVGLTGGIGSGKSVVARMLAQHGADVIDADQLAREVVEPGTLALTQIVTRFGPTVLDERGYLDRRKLGKVVFKDEKLRTELNQIVHPAVQARAMERINELVNQGSELIIYDVPLLYESGLERFFPEVVVVNVDPRVQRERIAIRDGLAAEEIEDRIAAQMPLAEKVARATYVIENSGTLESTRHQVDGLWARLAGHDQRS